MSTAKSDEIKVRVTHDMKAAIVRLASARGEGESVIVREAIKRYLHDLEPLRETPPPYGGHAVSKPEQPPQPPAPDTKKSRGLPGFAAALSLAALLLLAVGCATGPSLYERQLSEIETAYTAGQITAAQRLELRLQAQQAAAARAQADSAYWQNAGANANNAALQNFNSIRANQYNPYLKK